MESRLTPYHVVAQAVRVETRPESDTFYLVFEIVDEQFKQKIKTDWLQDIELKLIGKALIE